MVDKNKFSSMKCCCTRKTAIRIFFSVLAFIIHVAMITVVTFQTKEKNAKGKVWLFFICVLTHILSVVVTYLITSEIQYDKDEEELEKLRKRNGEIEKELTDLKYKIRIAELSAESWRLLHQIPPPLVTS